LIKNPLQPAIVSITTPQSGRSITGHTGKLVSQGEEAISAMAPVFREVLIIQRGDYGHTRLLVLENYYLRVCEAVRNISIEGVDEVTGDFVAVFIWQFVPLFVGRQWRVQYNEAGMSTREL
jgi:hypothetical protein